QLLSCDPSIPCGRQNALVRSLLEKSRPDVFVDLEVLLTQHIRDAFGRLLQLGLLLLRLGRVEGEQAQQSDACGDSQAPRPAEHAKEAAEGRTEASPGGPRDVPHGSAQAGQRALGAAD